MELVPEKSTLYSIEPKYHLYFKDVDFYCLGLIYFIKGLGMRPVFCKKNPNEDYLDIQIDLTKELKAKDRSYLLETCLIYRENGKQKFKENPDYGLHYGKLKLSLESTGKYNEAGELLCALKCDENSKIDKDPELDPKVKEVLKVKIEWLGIKYVYAKGDKGDKKPYSEDKKIPIKVNKDRTSVDTSYVFTLLYSNDSYKQCFNTKIDLRTFVI